MAVSTAELYRRGYSADDSNLVQTTQDAPRRTGAPYRTLGKLPISAFRPKININAWVEYSYKFEFIKLLSGTIA